MGVVAITYADEVEEYIQDLFPEEPEHFISLLRAIFHTTDVGSKQLLDAIFLHVGRESGDELFGIVVQLSRLLVCTRNQLREAIDATDC